RLKILCGGEALSLKLARQLLERATSLWNMYGPTETTIWSTVCQIRPDDEIVALGHPIANTQLYLLDGNAYPVPIGVPRQVYIGGDGLARSYLNRPELTAERFVTLDDWPTRIGETGWTRANGSTPNAVRLYRTGDLARYREDGRIEFLGRADHQVKLRGFRIE